jgi:branched-chain amino acid transport system substrate-binding protein
VLGKPVQYIEGDSGDASRTSPTRPSTACWRPAPTCLIGAASSGVTKTFLDKAVSGGAVVYSPANTSPDFTTIDDKGLYFRTAPSDVLQGRVLGETIVADGHENVAILSLQDPYGEGLSLNAGRAICAGGSNVVTETVFYDPASPNFDAQVGEVKAADPDAIILIGFEESAKIIQAMVGQQIGPQEVPVYLVDGNLGNALGEDLPEGVLEGTKGTLPGAQATEDFRAKLMEVDPELTTSATPVRPTTPSSPRLSRRSSPRATRATRSPSPSRTSPVAARSATASPPASSWRTRYRPRLRRCQRSDRVLRRG